MSDVKYRLRMLRSALAGLLADHQEVVRAASTWIEEDGAEEARLALLEENLLHLRVAADIAQEHAAALLDGLHRDDCPGAMPRQERVDWITEKALARARDGARLRGRGSPA